MNDIVPRVARLGLSLVLTTFCDVGLASAQSAPGRVPQPSTTTERDQFWYGRFGYGVIDRYPYDGLSFTFGRRIERGRLGLDLALFTGQWKFYGTSPDLREIGGTYRHAARVSLMNVKGLYLMSPRAKTSPYVGAGAGWGRMSFGRHDTGVIRGVWEDWYGRGLEAGLTAGYALARDPASTPLFVELDFALPVYAVRNESALSVGPGSRHTWAAGLSLGAGW